MTTTAFEALRSYINDTDHEAESGDSAALQALKSARDHAQEYALSVPDNITGQLISTLAAAIGGTVARAQAIVISPAASVTGLYILAGFGEDDILTCIDPEAEHQAHAKQAFRDAGYAANRVRFLPSRPLDVMGRLAQESYELIYADVAPEDLAALIDTAWPLLTPGGTLILANSLLDGTIADPARTDRATIAARKADEQARNLPGAVVSRLPLGAGLTLITKR